MPDSLYADDSLSPLLLLFSSQFFEDSSLSWCSFWFDKSWLDYVFSFQVGIDMEKFAHFSSDLQMVEALVSEESVFCLPGQCFDFPNFIRVVLTVPKELIVEACNRMAAFFCKYYVNPEKTKAVHGRTMNGFESQVEETERLIINLPPVAGTWPSQSPKERNIFMFWIQHLVVLFVLHNVSLEVLNWHLCDWSWKLLITLTTDYNVDQIPLVLQK